MKNIIKRIFGREKSAIQKLARNRRGDMLGKLMVAGCFALPAAAGVTMMKDAFVEKSGGVSGGIGQINQDLGGGGGAPGDGPGAPGGAPGNPLDGLMPGGGFGGGGFGF